MNRRSLYKRILFSTCFLFIVSIGYAQPGPPVDPDVPITGIEILLAAGGLFGVKKLLNRNKKNT